MSKKTKSKIVKIEVSQETVNYVQAIGLEVESRKSLLSSIAERLGIKSVQFKEYEEELVKFNSEFELIKEHLKNIYIPEELRDNHQLQWNLNYQTNILTVEVLCDCGIALVESGKLDFTPEFDDLVEKFSNKEDDEDCGCEGNCGCANCK